MRIRVGIVGFRGYGGVELVGILQRHSGVTPVLLEHRSDSESRALPRGWKRPSVAAATAEGVRQEALAVVFLATPADVSMALAPPMIEAGARIVGLRIGKGHTGLQGASEPVPVPSLRSQNLMLYLRPEW